MKNNTLLPVAALCTLLGSVSLSSHSETLLEIYELATENDREYKANIARFNADREAVNIARSDLLPQIIGSASYSDEDSDTSGTIDGVSANSDTSSDTTRYSISLEQTIINFNALNNYRGGKIRTAAAEVQLAADKQNLIIRSAQAYFDVLSAIDQLRTSQAEEKALATQLEQTRQRYEVGLISINDVYETQAAYDSSVADRISAEVNVGIQLEGLTILTGKTHSSIAPLKDDFIASYPSPNNKQTWIDAAKKSNLSLQVSKLNADAAVYDVKASRGNRLPTLKGSLSYGNSDTDRSGTSTRDTDTDTTTIGLDLSIPIYTGGSLTALQRQAVQNQIEARERFLLAQRNTIQSTRTIFLEVTTNIAQIKARKQAILSNESALEATKAGYEAGTRDIVDVVNAQRNLFQAQRDYFTTLYDYIVNTLELKEVAGTLAMKDLQELESWLQESKEITY
ncbi:MAG: TolC family outer membrane protein [Cellvibrionaceae bacterium]